MSKAITFLLAAAGAFTSHVTMAGAAPNGISNAPDYKADYKTHHKTYGENLLSSNRGIALRGAVPLGAFSHAVSSNVVSSNAVSSHAVSPKKIAPITASSINLLSVASVSVDGAAENSAQDISALNFGERIEQAALKRTYLPIQYDPSYVALAYPGGDVAADRGVCTDVVIRTLRTQGIDLQKWVHEDMRENFAAYPAIWGASAPDRNIDHRRAPNLETFFTRLGARLAESKDPTAYKPGDIVAWNLRGDAGFLPHIGVVTGLKGASGWPMVVHNIGAGPVLEDVLFAWPMTGRYRLSAHMFETH